ncbi:MAG TPA: hypothetical protein VGP52_07850 [Stellaceae bacterium]|jgi:hydrogenase maturation protease|nr:hypothetical protein [Stellaceae bacterium]
MNLLRVAEIARAILYEGYILYPYRPSAIKNRQRWTFGGVFPRAWAETEGGDPWHMQTQCLLRGNADAAVEVRVCFLQIVVREVYKLDLQGDDAEAAGEKVAAPVPWEEAIEREIVVPELPIVGLRDGPVSVPFDIPEVSEREPVADAGLVAGYVMRTAAALRGSIAIAADEVAGGVYRLSVRIENTTPWPVGKRRRENAQRSALASTHTILGVRDGAFLSLIDPPAELREAAAACVNQGAWPVLVGGEWDSDTMLAAPIILYDNPRIAPESPGDLFDGTEIDEILTLRILAMTDAEKQEMAAADTHARALLERVEALTPAQFGRLHGAMRRPGSQVDLAAGAALAVGARVRLNPKRRADIIDIVLKDQEAVIEAIERDFEDRVHVAVTLVDDPGRDLGLDRYPGHRFFFAEDEVELLEPEGGR